MADKNGNVDSVEELPNLMELLNPELFAQQMHARETLHKRGLEEVFGEAIEEIVPEPIIAAVESHSLPVPQAIAQVRVSKEMRALLVQYCASHVQAIQLSEVEWRPLAVRLGTPIEFCKAAAESANRDESLWAEVISERIRRVGATRTFRDVTWEKVESGTLDMLIRLIEKNLIRDPGELLAIASAARKINVGGESNGGGGNGTTLNVNFNSGGDILAPNDLPASGTKLSIDLSPRIASSLANRVEPVSKDGRVIDSEMLSAKELRSVLEQKHRPRETVASESEGENHG